MAHLPGWTPGGYGPMCGAGETGEANPAGGAPGTTTEAPPNGKPTGGGGACWGVRGCGTAPAACGGAL